MVVVQIWFRVQWPKRGRLTLIQQWFSCGSYLCQGGSVMAQICVASAHVVQCLMQMWVQLVVAQVDMVQVWFSVCDT